MKKNSVTSVLVPLAQGCEELEAITIIDLLVRAGVNVVTAGLDDAPVIASRGTKICPQTNIEALVNQSFDMVVLPGGLPGANHLRDSHTLIKILKHHAKNKCYLAAICAAPKVLAKAELLHNKTITCYPGALNDVVLNDTKITNKAIEIDGRIITSRGPGTAMDFSLALIGLLEGGEKRQEVEVGLVR